MELNFDFGGSSPYAIMTAVLPATRDKRGDGILFTLSREAAENGNPSYIDVVVHNSDGTTSNLQPNIFPVFLDGVNRETHVIPYDKLTPATNAAKARKVEIIFSSFGPQKVTNRLAEFQTWKRKHTK